MERPERMNGHIIVIQSSSALDPKIAAAAKEAGHEIRVIALGTDHFEPHALNDATIIILDSWDAAMMRRWAHLVEDTSRVIWIADAHVNAPEHIDEVIKRPFTTARLVEAMEAQETVKLPSILNLDSCSVDLERHQVQKQNTVHSLTQQETRLLRYFAGRPGKIITRNDLHVDVWDSHGEARGRAAAFAILRLRNKIEQDPKKPTHIITVRGIGYRWEQRQTRNEKGDGNDRIRQEKGVIHAYPTSFVGRTQLLGQIKGQLDEGTRLLTLVGPGGTGKTRLAKEACLLLQGQRSILFISLETSTSDESFVHQIANVIGCELNPETSIDDQVKHLGAALALKSSLLLVLDNFEQVGESCALHVNTWLMALPKLQVMVTSRIPLRLSIEEQCRIPSLDTEEAIQLFTDRGASARRGFTIQDEDKELVTNICHRLDYLPLAIELAAARLKVLSLQGLHERLSNRLDALVDRRSDPNERQRTLRSTLDWSWSLLTPNEQSVLSQLSVFHGGFTLPAAEEILQLTGEQNVLDVLESLHEKSLLNVSETDDTPDGVRFLTLDMVREYGEERLRESKQLDTIRQRHERYYLGLADSLKRSLFTSEEVHHHIQVEKFNIMAIAKRTTNADVLVRCLLVLDHELTQHGPYGLHMTLLERGVSFLEQCTPTLQVAVLRARGRAFRHRSRFDNAHTDLKRAVDKAETLGLVRDQSLALCSLAALTWERVRVIQAYDYFRQAAALQRDGSHLDLIGPTLYQLAIMNLEMKRFDKALELARESELLNRQESNHYYAAMAIHVQGVSHLAAGASIEAHDLLLKSKRELEQWNSGIELSALHVDLGIYHHLEGRLDEAIQWYTQAYTVAKQRKARRAIAHCRALLAVAKADTGNLMEATQDLDESERLCRHIHDSRGLGCIEVARGNLELARTRELFYDNAPQKLITRFIRKAEDRIEIPPVSGLTASCPSGIPLAEVSQDVRWFTQLLKRAMHHTREALQSTPSESP